MSEVDFCQSFLPMAMCRLAPDNDQAAKTGAQSHHLWLTVEDLVQHQYSDAST